MTQEGHGVVGRLVEGAQKSGPGWMLSAYTLGSGTAITSVLAGSMFGYALLWVNPLAMLIGVAVLTGAAYCALSSDKSPFHRFRTELNPALAYAWGIGSLLASVIWHLPQYGMVYASIRGLGGFEPSGFSQFVVGGVVVVVSVVITWQYRAGKGLLVYEGIMKLLVWMTVVCLVVLMFKLPIAWGQAAKGLVSFRIPTGSGIFIFGLMGAAVGINMTFLYPYSIRCKGWGRNDARLARRDLLTGMLVPFAAATGMLMIAATATLYGGDAVDRSKITQIAHVFTPAFGPKVGPTLFLLGLLAMPLGTITLHMLTCGFILSEMTGAEQGGRMWKIGTLIPAVGVVGVAYPLPVWLPVPTSAICLILLPIAYIGFALLVRRDVKKPDAAPFPGGKAMLYTMYAAIAAVTVVAAIKAGSEIAKLIAP